MPEKEQEREGERLLKNYNTKKIKGERRKCTLHGTMERRAADIFPRRIRVSGPLPIPVVVASAGGGRAGWCRILRARV